MTCIVGIVENGRVYMGADSIAFDGLDMVTRATPKIFTVGPFAVGVAGSPRVSDLLHYKFTPPEITASQTLHEFMVTTFVDAMRDCLKTAGAAQIENNVEEVPASILVGFQGALFTIESDYQVGVNTEPYAAVGCGASIAMGALYAAKGKPRHRLTIALKASEAFNAGVRHPWIFLSV